MLEIIPSTQRQHQTRGAKILLCGPSGVGKTSQLRKLDPAGTLFIDIESGDLSVQDLAIDTAHVKSWAEACELAAAINGGELAKYKTIFVDSITAASRLSFSNAQQHSGRDIRAAYGLHARQLLAWLHSLQQARATNIVLVAILEIVKDDFGRIEHRLQLEGQRTGLELPGIVDEIVTMAWVDFGDKLPVRAFVCTQPNQWNYPAKDRSGRLGQFEKPDLGALITKLTATKEN
jgi:hypothetical protein